MLRSLVGSEMCIRDSLNLESSGNPLQLIRRKCSPARSQARGPKSHAAKMCAVARVQLSFRLVRFFKFDLGPEGGAFCLRKYCCGLSTGDFLAFGLRECCCATAVGDFGFAHVAVARVRVALSPRLLPWLERWPLFLQNPRSQTPSGGGC